MSGPIYYTSYTFSSILPRNTGTTDLLSLYIPDPAEIASAATYQANTPSSSPSSSVHSCASGPDPDSAQDQGKSYSADAHMQIMIDCEEVDVNAGADVIANDNGAANASESVDIEAEGVVWFASTGR